MDLCSYKIRIFDTQVIVHCTFFLQLGLGILQSIKSFHLLKSIFIFLEFGPILFITILTHAFGHILATKALGGTTNGIVLWPLGGSAIGSTTGKGPCDKLKVSIAGQLTHVPQVCIWYGFYYLTTKVFSYGNDFDFQWFVHQLFKIGFDSGLLRSHFLLLVFAKAAQLNVMMVIFNSLPLYPLDGIYLFVSSLLLCGLDQNRTGLLVAKAGMAISLICGVLLGLVFFQSGFNLVVFAWCFYKNWDLYKLAENERADEHPLFTVQEHVENNDDTQYVDQTQSDYDQMPTWSSENKHSDTMAKAPWWKFWRGTQSTTSTAINNQDSQAFLSTAQNNNAAVEEDYGF